MKLIALAGALIGIVGGCATGPQYQLVKNVSQQEIQQDNAACQNQAQLIQVSDWEYKGTFMEGANIKMKQNRAFENCLISKGYVRQSTDTKQANSPFSDQLKFNTAELDALCAKAEYKSIFERTSCGKQEISMQMLSDNTKITKPQKRLMEKFDSEQKVISDERSALISSSNDAKYKEYNAWYESNVRMPAMLNKTELYEGKITWGQYNKVKMQQKIQNTNKFNEIKNR